MKILSIRKGFCADHSSTSYEFYAIDTPLNAKDQAEVSKLSSRVNPTGRRASFIYHGDWSDLPGGWEPLMEKYYDVMYSESYDWWTLGIAFNTNKKTIEEIKKFDFAGVDDLGVSVYNKNNRVIVSIYCRLDPVALEDWDDDYYENDEYFDDEEVDVESTNDSLLELLQSNRDYLIQGDYRLLSGVINLYGIPEDMEYLPVKSPDLNDLPAETQDLLSCIIIDY